MSKRPMGHGDLRNMSNFKAVAIDYEFYLTLSDEPVSVCLTERQMYVLSVQNTYTAWLTRWYHTDDINQNVVAAIAAEIEALLMCGCGIPQPTLTDRLNSITYNTATTTIYQNTENTWNAGGQTVVSIAPNLDWDTGDPIDISKLTCAAIKNLLNAIAGQGKQLNQQTADQGKDLVNGISSALGGLATASGAAGAVVALTGATLGFFASPWLTFGLALGAVGTKVASLFIAAPPTLFDDAEALEKVACTIFTNTNDGSMTREKFVGSLTPNDFDPGSPEAQLAAMVQPYLDDLTVYLQFMSLGNQLYEVTDFATLPECSCEEDPCADTNNFKASMNGWEGFQGSAEGYYYNWEPGQGIGRGTTIKTRIGLRKNLGSIESMTIIWNVPTYGTIRLYNYAGDSLLYTVPQNSSSDVWGVPCPGFTSAVGLEMSMADINAEVPDSWFMTCITYETE